MKYFRLIAIIVIGITAAGYCTEERGVVIRSQYKDGETIFHKFIKGKNHALIIGINSYQHHPNLKTAVNDAEAIAKLLTEQYFFDPKDVVLLKDQQATKTQILQELRDLIALKIEKGDNVFIYYAGHGWYDNILESGYWVTAEATKDPSTFLENHAVYKSIEALDKKGVQHILLVSDSCFSGSFTQEHRSIETGIDDRYFMEKYSKPSRNILTSGGIEPVADGGKDGHSIFAYYFLKTLKENPYPYLSVKQIGFQVEELVTRNSNQTPASQFIHGVGDEQGQFFFINKKGKTTERGSSVIVEPIQQNREPEYGEITIETNVAEADVYLDGNKKGKGSLKLKNMAAGKYQVRVEAVGYEPYETFVELESGQSQNLKAILKITEQKQIAEQKPHSVEIPSKSLKHGSKIQGNIKGMEFVYIEPGKFIMGTPLDDTWNESDEISHEATLTNGFYIQTTEVTQAQWMEIMGDNPSYFRECGSTCPVENVSWDDVQEFIRRLNRKQGAEKYRLPTEAEWEYSAKASVPTAFANGELTNPDCSPLDPNLDKIGWYCGNSDGKPHPVGKKKPNPWGLYDMHGNIWEWCQDRYGDYPVADPSSCSMRVNRGGSWNSSARNCRSANRSCDLPGFRSGSIGFRLIMND